MNYVLITPAHNEEAFIAQTIESVIAQKVLPTRWVVVNDASTDNTSKIVERYTLSHCFIKLVNVERPSGRHFGNKVRAFSRGLEEMHELNFDFIGNLDADVSFTPDYFATVLAEFEKDPRLGIAGGMIHTRVEDEYISQNVALDSVAGAVQFFRRACFEQIGGYKALPNGGIDAVAEITARMMGWRVRTIADLHVLEHRRTGSATARPLAARLKEGYRFHSLGYGFLFFCARCAYRLREQPTIVGSIVAVLGYLKSWIRRDPVAVSPDVVNYLRLEQRAKLARALRIANRRTTQSSPS